MIKLVLVSERNSPFFFVGYDLITYQDLDDLGQA